MDLMKMAGEYGVAIAALVVALFLARILADLVKKKWYGSEAQERRIPYIVECPNHVEGLGATVEALVSECHTISSQNRAQLRHLEHNGEGIDALIESHKPVGGREWWKATDQSEKIQVEIRDGIRDMQTGIGELVRIARKNGGSAR